MPASVIAQRFQVSNQTLRRWASEGKIHYVQTPGGRHLYSIQDALQLFQGPPQEAPPPRDRICYCRVSSSHQRGDLERQVEYLRTKFPNHEILQDIGSGLNFERPSFKRLLDRVYEGSVMEVMVTNKDRLARFRFELIQWLFKKTYTKLLVLHNHEDQQDSRTEELAEDLLSIVTVFVAKHHGRRGAENRRKRKALAQERKDNEESSSTEDEEESQQTARRKSEKDPPISKQRRKRKA